MEKAENKKLRQQKMENMVLALYCIYNIGISTNIMCNGWEKWVVYIINAGWLVSLMFFVCRYKSYRFRAFFTAVMMQIGILLYTIQVPDLFSELINILAVTILLGMYGMPEIIGITFISDTFLFGYHIVILEEFSNVTSGEMPRLLQKIASVYLAEYMMYYLVKKQKKANEEQQTIIEKLEEAEHSKDDFLANVSHEIRTPINTIYGMCELLLQENLPKHVTKDIYDIQTAGRNLLSIVSDVIDFSELQSGKIELAEVTYNITSTVNDVINMTMARKDEKQIRLLVDCDVDIPSGLYGDEQKIRRVVMNLLNNAIKFTNKGFVAIRFTFRKTDYGINLMICIRDTGIGMSDESIEKLFSTYNQVDTKRNRHEGGIGLGIAISQAIVEEMGGFITVKSELGKGSEFKVIIPQKVVDETPIVQIKSPNKINAAFYMNMEQYPHAKIRGGISGNITHIMEQLRVNCQLFYKFADLKRKVEHENFTHIFISMVEYKEEEDYFDELSGEVKVIVVLEREDDSKISNTNILRIYKPFFVLAVAALLNDEQNAKGAYGNSCFHNGFIAPSVHVLVVDDNLMNLKVVEGLLQCYQIKVSKAVSGKEALEKIETMEYDFVFMDHMMPEMDGIETLHRIRRKRGEYFKKVPIVALTANAVAGMREVFLEEGFQDFIAKPVEVSVLESVLKRVIPKEKMIRQNISDRKAKEENGQAVDTSELVIGDLDVQKGIVYCGSRENYEDVLFIHCKNGAGNIDKIQKSYQEKDWKNYGILLHALKSSMQSIGALPLSQMAKELERAAKEKEEKYILNHHKEAMEEYDRILKILKEYLKVDVTEKETDGKEEETGEIVEPELSEDEFDNLARELEEAAYDLEGDTMAEIVEKMQQYSYHGYLLKEELAPVKRKIEMNDYMSASETVSKLKTKRKGVM
ncbi:MAG: response regulator [Clostridiales bacterium]|nr:response regulator [Clostridiales bacterium]